MIGKIFAGLDVLVVPSIWYETRRWSFIPRKRQAAPLLLLI